MERRLPAYHFSLIPQLFLPPPLSFPCTFYAIPLSLSGSLFQSPYCPMANLPTSRDGGRESQPDTCDLLHARLVISFSVLSHWVWGGIRSLAAFTFMWLVMLGLPLIYKARLAELERSSGGQLALEQIPAQEDERVERANTQQFDGSNLSTIHRGQGLIKRCVFEWQACTMLNTVTLGYAPQLHVTSQC